VNSQSEDENKRAVSLFLSGQKHWLLPKALAQSKAKAYIF
jgi:hypothetical protein